MFDSPDSPDTPDVFLTLPGTVPVREGQTLIDVYMCRAYVARYHITGPTVHIEPATNAGALEADARAAIYEQSGSITCRGQYPCPPALAAKARWKRQWRKNNDYKPRGS